MKKYFRNHKIIGVIIVLAIIFGGYQIYKSWNGTSAETRYVLAAAKKGALVSLVTGTGQVTTTSQIDLKAKAGGDIVYVGVENGQSVGAGQLIARIDSRDAEKAVRDAAVALDSAKLTLAKMEKPNEQELSATKLAKTFQDGLAVNAKAYPDLFSVINSLNHIYFDNDFDANNNTDNIEYYVGVIKSYDPSFQTVALAVKTEYDKIKSQYDQAFADYKTASLEKNNQSSESVIRSTYALLRAVANLNKVGRDTVQFFKNKSVLDSWQSSKPAVVDQHFTDLTANLTTVNDYLGDLGAIVNTINDQQNATAVDELDIQAQKLVIKQKTNALLDAQENLGDYAIRAPFDGLIAKLDIKKFDSVGVGGVVGILVTKQKIAEISLNEVDAAGVKIGNKVTLTFDAIENLNIAGTVNELDLVGTITQGVVTYNVKVFFDAQDERVKPGMSVSAAIVTNAKQDVLTIPVSAIKGEGDKTYVEIFDPPLSGGQNNQGVISPIPPRQKRVAVGLTNDTLAEIVSGLEIGDEVVTRTIASTVANRAASAPSIFGGGTRSPVNTTRPNR